MAPLFFLQRRGYVGTLQQALKLYRSGGTVIALDATPIASERSGRDDPEFAPAFANSLARRAKKRTFRSFERLRHAERFFSPYVKEEDSED